MVATLTDISPKDIVKRIMDGERDFSSTRLSGALEDEAGYAGLVAYLRERDLRAETLMAAGSDWSGLSARGLYFPFSKLAGINLSGADLRGADFRRADFTGANLEGADLSGATVIGCRFQEANLAGATLRATDFYEASLAGAKLPGADLTRAFLLRLALKQADLTGAVLTSAIMYRTDLRGVVGLDRVTDLATVTFHQTIVTAAERAIIDAAIGEMPLFEMRSGTDAASPNDRPAQRPSRPQEGAAEGR